MKYLKLWNSFTESLAFSSKKPKHYYHGTNDKHEFNSTGNLVRGTFFSPSQQEASNYGSFLYRATFKDDLNIWSVNNPQDCKELLDVVGELYDTYYDETDENYVIDSVAKLCGSNDNWEAIENTAGALEYLSRHYDAIEVVEGGISNVLIFSPVKDKLQSIELVN